MSKVSRVPGVVAETVGGQAMLIDVEGEHMITLNEVGTVVWEHLDDPRTRDELVRFLVERYPATDPTVIAADVEEFLEEMAALGVVADAVG